MASTTKSVSTSSSISTNPPAALRTPAKQTASPVIDSPGNWKHPRLLEITRRRNATTFTEKNAKRIVYNVAALVILWVSRILLGPYLSIDIIPRNSRIYVSWAYSVAQALPLLNIVLAVLPLVRPKDDFADIPLTPGQRKLLNLPATTTPVTPNSKFSTPPRYSRTPSLAGSVGSKASYTGSPLSGRGSPAVATKGTSSGSPYSPAGSPLPQKAFNPTLDSNRTSSFGSPSPLGSLNAPSNPFPDLGTPSPTASKRTSIGLNNKWLYERGRRSSGGSWMQ